MVLLRRLSPFAYLALQFGANFVVVLYLGLVGFGLRDQFCYHDYSNTIVEVMLYAVGLCTLAQVPSFAILKWGFKISTYKAATPYAALVVMIILIFGADLYLRALNDTHCAAGSWEIQDNTINTPHWLEALVEYGTGLMALICLMSTLWLFIVSLRCAFNTQAP